MWQPSRSLCPCPTFGRLRWRSLSLSLSLSNRVMAEDEEMDLEQQLEVQLEEQKDSLKAINDALVSDPSNTELLSVHEELVLAITDAEEGLFHLKRSRLMREADLLITKQDSEPNFPDVKAESLDPTQVEAEPLGIESYPIGTKCRFRHTNGRWYNGHVVGLEGASCARISFLTPTSENMLMCKFFLQQRCRFGSNCRSSHGIGIPMSSLKQYIPTVWQQSLVGSSIWAFSNSQTGIWREAELASWDDRLSLGRVVFRDDGSSENLGVESLSLSKYAQMSEVEEESRETDSGSETSESGDDKEDPESEMSPRGLGFLEATILQCGVQTETAVFAKWENHTRGIASKMMANMGYREGMGLGIDGQGILDPISVKVLPPKQSLDRALGSNQSEEENKPSHGKKRSRGGRRKREKKYAAAARAAKKDEEELNTADVFKFINNQLAMQNSADTESMKKQSRGLIGEVKPKGEDRRALLAYDDEVRELKSRVEKLEEMASRNWKEKVVYEAANRKLIETRKALAEVEAAHASASNAVFSKEKEKRWLKF